MELGGWSLRLELQGSALSRVRQVDILLEDVVLNVMAQVPLLLEKILLQGTWNAAVELFTVAKAQWVLGQWLALHH